MKKLFFLMATILLTQTVFSQRNSNYYDMKKISTFLLLIQLFYSVNGQTVISDPVIGKVFKHVSDIPRFKNYKEYEGMAIEPLESGVCFSKVSNGVNTFILFNKYIAPASYKVLAVLSMGVVTPNTIIIMGRCRVNNKNDGTIIALIKPNRGPYFKNVIKAWRADVKTNKFISISAKGIDCINDESDTD